MKNLPDILLGFWFGWLVGTLIPFLFRLYDTNLQIFIHLVVGYPMGHLYVWIHNKRTHEKNI